jgi:MFS family permease
VGLLLASTAISVTGDGAFIAAAPLLAASLTRDPFAIATVTAAMYVPWLLVGLLAGALVDIWPRRRVMVTADLVRGGLLAVLALLVQTQHIAMWGLVLVVFTVGVAQCFFDAAAQASIPILVGRDKDALTRVNGRYWALDTMGRGLVGPPAGSISFAAVRALPFFGDAVSFIASAVLVRRLPDEVAVPSRRLEGVLASVRTGLRHLWRTPDLRVLALSMGAYNFGYNMAFATFVLFARDLLDIGTGMYGVLLATAAIGGVVAGWRAQPWTARLSYRQIQAVAHALQATAWLGIAVLHSVGPAVVLLFVLGAGSTLASVAVGSARQALTPDPLLGRVVSAFRLFGLGAAGVGALVGGAVADAVGLRAPLFSAAALLAVAAVVTWPFAAGERHS